MGERRQKYKAGVRKPAWEDIIWDTEPQTEENAKIIIRGRVCKYITGFIWFRRESRGRYF
jgi:hypothetical protein